MNILILNWKDIKHPQVGGAEIIVYELARRLVKNKHDVTWLCRSFKGAKSKEDIEGIKIIRRGNLLSVYLHAPYYYYSLKDKPNLVIDMSNTIYWQTPLWVKYSKKLAYLNQLAQEVFDYEYSKPVAFFGKLIERLQYLTYKKIPFACYSKSTKEDLSKVGISSTDIHLFSLGLDHTRYVLGEKSETPIFLCVSRLVRMKRTDLAIQAMKYVIQKYPEVKLYIVGYGYERKRLQELTKELGLEKSILFVDENILFFGKNIKDEKVKLMQKAWALIFPSVKEGWGMTVTECAACATPAIVSNVTGLRDSVVKNKTGIILSKNPSAKDISDAMMMIIENKSLRNDLGKNCIAWAKGFSWDKSFKEFQNIIESI